MNQSFWIGQDGNVYVTSPQGVQNFGKPVGSPTATGVETATGSLQATQIQDPLAGSGSTTSSTSSPGTASAISQINSQLGTLDPQQAAGLSNITSSYNNAVNQENGAFQGATDQYNTTRQNTIQNEVQAKDQIDQGVNQNTNALQRLLGLAGSGDSSAASILAPYAAAKAGATQSNQVQNAYGQNLQSIDTSWLDPNIGTVAKHNQTLGNLSDQEFQNEQSLKQGIANTRASLLSSLANATSSAGGNVQPILDQLTQIAQGAAALSNQYQNPISLTTPSSYTPPSLASYNVGSTGVPSSGTANASATAQQTAPYLATLFGQQKNANGNPILS